MLSGTQCGICAWPSPNRAMKSEALPFLDRYSLVLRAKISSLVHLPEGLGMESKWSKLWGFGFPQGTSQMEPTMGTPTQTNRISEYLAEVNAFR